MAEFYSVSLEEMDAFLRPMRFQPVDLTYRRRPVKEWVYQRPVPSRANHFVRVYTGINRYGQQQNQSRGVGKDAIRVQVIYRDEAGFETLVTQPKRVHRVQGWADNLANRLEEINRTRPQVAFDSRGKPMTLRKGKTGWFWGSSDYPRYKETRPFVAETYEAAYQPDQTLSDYSPEQLTESSAIEGYQPLKYSVVGNRAETFEAEDNYEATYGKAQAKIRRRLKKKIKAQAIMGTKAGQWSARKSQELKRQYEAACEKRGLAAYKGQKTQSQKNLSNWSQQKWRTASGKNSSDTGEPYFPAKAVEALKKKGLYAKAKRQKAAATKAGKQSARYSDDIRAVVRKYRAESDAIPKNWELIEYEGHPALYRHIATADYNTTWQLVEFADDLNLRLKHHATVQFTASSIEIWLWTHDSETITYRDEYWAEAYDELLQLATIVDNLEFDSESVPEDWEDIKWKEEKPEHIGDSAEWESEQGSDWGSLRPMQLNERGDYYPTEEAYIEAMLRRFPKMNIHGERGCPVCGSETLFMRETTGKGLKWRCYGCNYSDESLSEKSKKIDTLEKFGLTLRCPDCGEDFKAYNREAIRYHQKKCGA